MSGNNRKCTTGKETTSPYCWGEYLPSGNANKDASNDWEYTCNHKWVNVGFQHDKYVCSKCDIEAPTSAIEALNKCQDSDK